MDPAAALQAARDDGKTGELNHVPFSVSRAVMRIRNYTMLFIACRRCLCLILLVAVFTAPGCIVPGGEGFYTYEATGKIVSIDGLPRTSRVVVAWGPAHESQTSSQLRKMFRDDAVTTDNAGVYTFELVRGVGPTMATFGAPTVGEAVVYVQQPDGWHMYRATLDKHAQEKNRYGRRIMVPPLVIGRETTLAVVKEPDAARNTGHVSNLPGH